MIRRHTGNKPLNPVQQKFPWLLVPATCRCTVWHMRKLVYSFGRTYRKPWSYTSHHCPDFNMYFLGGYRISCFQKTQCWRSFLFHNSTDFRSSTRTTAFRTLYAAATAVIARLKTWLSSRLKVTWLVNSLKLVTLRGDPVQRGNPNQDILKSVLICFEDKNPSWWRLRKMIAGFRFGQTYCCTLKQGWWNGVNLNHSFGLWDTDLSLSDTGPVYLELVAVGTVYNNLATFWWWLCIEHSPRPYQHHLTTHFFATCSCDLPTGHVL